jgi:DNA-binding MarR family transcriptional regulator
MSSPKQFSDVLQEWAGVFMRRSMEDFRRFMDASGLSSTQIQILMRLHFGGSCDVTEIGNHLGITNAAASQTIERLVQMGLLTRAEDPLDRRVKRIAPTPKGHSLVEEGIEARRRWLEGLTQALSTQEQEMIAEALKALTEAAHKTEDWSPVKVS